MRFVVVGEGFPATKLVDRIAGANDGELVGIYTGAAPSRMLRAAAERAGASLDSVASLTTAEGLRRLKELAPDWLINANSTVILPAAVLAVPASGCLNMHPGLLPEYAGLHVHQWAIRRGESRFGSTVHFMEPGVDTGDIVATETFEILDSDTGLSLFQKCIDAGVRLLDAAIDCILEGKPLARRPQDLSARTIFRHRDALEPRIDWSASAREVRDFVRAGNYGPFGSPTYAACLDPVQPSGETPIVQVVEVAESVAGEPGAVAGFADADPLIVCGDGRSVALRRVIVNGRRFADWREYFAALPAGKLLGRAGE